MTDRPDDSRLDREFAYTEWHNSCRDIYSLDYQCRRPVRHEGPHAAGFGSARIVWDLTREEQEEIYGGPLPKGLVIRRFTEEERRILDEGTGRE